jgi:hypothetical protein
VEGVKNLGSGSVGSNSGDWSRSSGKDFRAASSCFPLSGPMGPMASSVWGGPLAGWRGEGEHFVDPSQEGGPPGGLGGGGIRCLPVCLLWLGRRDLGGGWGESIETGDLSGQGVVLLGPCGDQRSQGSIGGEDTVVLVVVDAGRGEDGGEPVQKLESRETQRGSAGQVGFWETVIPGEHIFGLVGLQDPVAASQVAHGVGRVAP